MDMPFYDTGRVKKKPLGEDDIRITCELLEKVKPHQVYAAGDLSDPHGTHRIGNRQRTLLGASGQIRDIRRNVDRLDHLPGDAKIGGGLLATRVGEIVEVLVAETGGVGHHRDRDGILGAHTPKRNRKSRQRGNRDCRTDESAARQTNRHSLLLYLSVEWLETTDNEKSARLEHPR